MSKKEKRQLKRILISGVIFLLAMPLHYRYSLNLSIDFKGINILELGIFLIAYFIIGFDVLSKAARNIRNGQVFDENFLMCIATIGAFLLQEYPEGVAVMLFYQVGELFQSMAVSRSRKSVADLMDIRPDYANVMREGVLTTVSPEEVAIGDTIVVKPGERIPLDGVIKEGSSSLDTSALTGESMPRDVSVGDDVISGCINKTGLLSIAVNKPFSESTVVKILELVESASDRKSRSEAFITRFARYYTPAVVIAAVLLAVLPPLLTQQPFRIWIERALIFLVISCPCALVISVPLSFFGGIGGASKNGILVKGSSFLEALSKTETVVFDKTGTLTKGEFAVTGINAVGISEEELIKYAAYAESFSTHPIAESIKAAYGAEIDQTVISSMEEIPGHGVKAVSQGKTILAGNKKLMDSAGVTAENGEYPGTVVHIAIDGAYAGFITIEDELKPDAKTAIMALKQAGIKNTAMLTGDSDSAGKSVAKALSIDSVYTRLLPAEKVERMEALLEEKSPGKTLVYVGDGINDAPVLARADVGIAMGGLGSDAAIEAADVVIMTDEPSKIILGINISKKTMGIVRQNIVFSLFVKLVVMILGAMGLASMWWAVFADVGVSVIAILNAIRAMRI